MYKYKILALVLSLGVVSPVLGSETEIAIEWKNDYSNRTLALSAPFTVDQIIEHAGTQPETYDMEFLNSAPGKRLIKETIDNLNANKVPEPDIVDIAMRYNRDNPVAGYNKSVIAHYVSELKRTLSEKK